MKYPNFLGIGAQKAGTTWLYDRLREHPDVYLPRVKELHYFDRALDEAKPGRLAIAHPFDRLRTRPGFERMLTGARKVATGVLHADPERVAWNARWYFGVYGDDWYRSLFECGSGKARGEITPSYAILPHERVAHIARLLPEAKIIFLLRNPIERAWSQLRFQYREGKDVDLSDPANCIRWIERDKNALKSDYENTLATWEKHFPREQILLGFYDAVSEQPGLLLRGVLEYLEVDSSHANAASLREKVNVSPERDMPPEIAAYLASKFGPMIQRLATRFGGYCERWRSRLEGPDSSAQEAPPPVIHP